jgi:hypothetical protein
MLDEIGSYDTEKLRQSSVLRGLQQFVQGDGSNYFVALWVSGVVKESHCNIVKNIYRRKGVDLLMLEVYCNYITRELHAYNPYFFFDQGISMVRKQDIISNTVFTLGILEDVKRKESLEEQVRYIRINAPEMPGIGFYHEKGAPDVLEFADYLCLKYFIRPVIAGWKHDLIFSNPTPEADKWLTISAKIYNIGGMDSGPVNVNFYCGSPASGGVKIGTERIASLPAQKGNFQPEGSILKTRWKPQKGYHEIWIEAVPENTTDTILQNVYKKSIYVR